MTLYKLSDASNEVCEKCGGPLAYRQEHPYPVVIHILFALSFILFLVLFDRIRAYRPAIWIWSAVQIGLGGFLIRGRMRAKKRVLRCIRCLSDLR